MRNGWAIFAVLLSGCVGQALGELEQDCARQGVDVLKEAEERRLGGMNVRLTVSHFNRRESKCYVSIIYEDIDVRREPSAMPIPVDPRPVSFTEVVDASEHRPVVVFTTSNLAWDAVRETFCRVTDAGGRITSGDCAAAQRAAQLKMSQ